MSKRPRPPDDLPASNGQPGPAAAPRPPVADRPDTAHPAPMAAVLASRWAVILKRFRDYMNQR
jgi:hypothetical protein